MSILPEKIKQGEYLCFLDGSTQIGGAIYWNRDEKDNKIFWTSCFWLFQDIRNIKVEFYNVKDSKLEIVGMIPKATLDIPHNLIIGKELLGSIRIICI